MKRIAISQSNYIPWKGYFNLINSVDEFVLYDSMQYTKNDWRNRNKIKTKNGTLWLSIPIKHKGRISNLQKISESEVLDSTWAKKHWHSIKANYAKATYFKTYEEIFYNLYLKCANFKLLSEINYNFICAINNILGIKTKITFDSNYYLSGGKTQRLINICKQANADIYVSSPIAKNYLQKELFKSANIMLLFGNYENYKQYSQLYPPFVHEVSILDLIFNEGSNAMSYLKDDALFMPLLRGGGDL